MKDQEIYNGLKSNNAKTITYIYKRFKPMALAWVMRSRGNRQDGEDMFSKTFLSILKSIQENRYEQRDLFEAFFWKCLKNNWLQELRHRERKPVSNDKNETELLLKPDENALIDKIIKNDLLEKIYQGIERLGEPCRSWLKRFYKDDVTCHELAVEENVSDSTMRVRLHRCRETLCSLMPKD